VTSGISAVTSGIRAVTSGIRAVTNGTSAVTSGISAVTSGISAVMMARGLSSPAENIAVLFFIVQFWGFSHVWLNNLSNLLH